VIIDENLAPALARSLQELFRDEHEIVHLRRKFGPGVKDVDWITQLSQDGTWIVISGDRRITRTKAEFNAFQSSRLIGFFLSKGLYKSPLVKQAERILALWPAMMKLASSVRGGAMFQLPMKSTRIEQLRV
jgi:hypothetical protein